MKSKVCTGERRVESGQWRVERGEWRVKSGLWRLEGGEGRMDICVESGIESGFDTGKESEAIFIESLPFLSFCISIIFYCDSII